MCNSGNSLFRLLGPNVSRGSHYLDSGCYYICTFLFHKSIKFLIPGFFFNIKCNIYFFKFHLRIYFLEKAFFTKRLKKKLTVFKIQNIVEFVVYRFLLKLFIFFLKFRVEVFFFTKFFHLFTK